MSTSTASTAPTLRRKKRKALSERTNSFDESLGPVDAKRRRPLPAHERLFANCGVVGSGVFGDVKLVECHQTKARFVLKVGSAGEAARCAIRCRPACPGMPSPLGCAPLPLGGSR